MALTYTCPILLGGSLVLFIRGVNEKEGLAEVSIFPKEELDFCLEFSPHYTNGIPDMCSFVSVEPMSIYHIIFTSFISTGGRKL